MKLVATSPFLNVPKLNIRSLEGLPEGKEIPKEIPKGARFTIGKAETFQHLNADDKEAVAWLWNSGRIVTPDNVQAVRLIDTEVETEKKHAKKLEEQAQAGNSQAFVEQFMAMFKQMTAKKV